MIPLTRRQIDCAAVLLSAGVKPSTSPEYAQLLQRLVEDKNIGTQRHALWGFKDLHAMELRTILPTYSNLKGVAHKRGKQELAAVKASIVDKIQDTVYNAKRFLKGAPDERRKQGRMRMYSQELEDVLKKAYFDTYLLGIKGSGQINVSDLDAEDLRWIESAWRNEKKYLDSFIKDVLAGKDRMSIDKRAQMYGNTLDSIYDAARVSGVDPWVLIYWIQDKKAENCTDCADIARYSPFTKRTLPTTPGAGETRCLSNCKCSLRIRPSTPEKVRERERQLPGRAELLRRVKSIHMRHMAYRRGVI